MRLLPTSVLALASAAMGVSALARPLWAGGYPPPGRSVTVGIGAPGWGYGGRWVGGPYRPWVAPGYRYGYGGWGYGYPGYGYGIGVGYGAGWALAAGAPWYWGGPLVYSAPAVVTYGVVAPSFPSFELHEDVTYVQQPQAQATPQPPAAPAPAQRQRNSYWYYCTEPAGYHPYVKQCSRPWIAVNPESVQAADAARPAVPAP